MNKLLTSFLVIAMLVLYGSKPSAADETNKPAAKQQMRRLIYCAGLMTHEEREAYRERMRAAGSPEERAKLREAHRQNMQDRARKSGKDPQVCEPGHYRLQYRGGNHENAN